METVAQVRIDQEILWDAYESASSSEWRLCGSSWQLWDWANALKSVAGLRNFPIRKYATSSWPNIVSPSFPPNLLVLDPNINYNIY